MCTQPAHGEKTDATPRKQYVYKPYNLFLKKEKVLLKCCLPSQGSYAYVCVAQPADGKGVMLPKEAICLQTT